jgi:homogentisate 1,2-dioxygenase
MKYSPGALPPAGQNVPQKCPFDLYSEQVGGIRYFLKLGLMFLC